MQLGVSGHIPCPDHSFMSVLVTVFLQVPLGWWAELQLPCCPGKQSPNWHEWVVGTKVSGHCSMPDGSQYYLVNLYNMRHPISMLCVPIYVYLSGYSMFVLYQFPRCSTIREICTVQSVNIQEICTERTANIWEIGTVRTVNTWEIHSVQTCW